ncbi:MAG: alpha/beta fold hydrolase [Proteobacteria bacterium]|nr:alpha/beta fold hydrolase [Pseudomonadota bacterium]
MQWVPEIGFCGSRDGTRLAMGSYGAGARTVLLATLHISDHLGAPSIGSCHWLELLAPNARIIRYDARGCGLSAGEGVGPLNLQTCVEDIEAVVDAAGVAGPLVLVSLSHGILPVIAFAALHPDRVERIVVLAGYARGRLRRNGGPELDRESQAIIETMQVAYGADLTYSAPFRRVLLSRLLPRANEEQITELDRASIKRMTSSVAGQYTRFTFNSDVSDLARRIACPALVIHANDDPVVPFSEGSHLAALIPGARLLPLEGCLHLPLEGDPEWPRISGAIRSFLEIPSPPASARLTVDGARSSAPRLTPRQREVLQLVGRGHTDKEIARAMGLSHRTVEMHVRHCLEALGCRSRAEGVRVALQRGLLDGPADS